MCESKELYLWEEYAPKPLDFSTLPYFTEPKNDNEQLFNLQYEYRNNGIQSAIATMYTLLQRISAKIITKECKKRKIRGINRKEKAQDVATYIVEQFLSREDFVIEKSFVAYCFLQSKHELTYKKEIDKITDFVGDEYIFEQMEIRQ